MEIESNSKTKPQEANGSYLGKRSMPSGSKDVTQGTKATKKADNIEKKMSKKRGRKPKRYEYIKDVSDKNPLEMIIKVKSNILQTTQKFTYDKIEYKRGDDVLVMNPGNLPYPFIGKIQNLKIIKYEEEQKEQKVPCVKIRW